MIEIGSDGASAAVLVSTCGELPGDEVTARLRVPPASEAATVDDRVCPAAKAVADDVARPGLRVAPGDADASHRSSFRVGRGATAKRRPPVSRSLRLALQHGRLAGGLPHVPRLSECLLRI